MEHLTNFSGKVLENESLSRHTYYRIGGPARFLVEPIGMEDLRIVHNFIKKHQLPYFFLGKGSNLLVSDEGFPGVVIKTQKLNTELRCSAENVLKVGSGVAVTQLLREAGENGWGGLEFLAGIPGSIGGVVFMNAGTHLGEVSSYVLAVEAFNFEDELFRLERFELDVLAFQYRKNLFLKPSHFIWGLELSFTPGTPDRVRAQIKEVLDRRKSTQPLNRPSCGSVFKNPKPSGLHAWQVIEKLGLRGYQMGAAAFSEVHCNFIVNLGDAKASDVKGLIDLAKRRAEEELGIRLEEEVQYLGYGKLLS